MKLEEAWAQRATSAADEREEGTLAALDVGGLRAGLVPPLLRVGLSRAGVGSAWPADATYPGFRALLVDLRESIVDAIAEGSRVRVHLDGVDEALAPGELETWLPVLLCAGAAVSRGGRSAGASPAVTRPADPVADLPLGWGAVESWTAEQLTRIVSVARGRSWQAHWAGLAGWGLELHQLRRDLLAGLPDRLRDGAREALVASVFAQSRAASRAAPSVVEALEALVALSRVATLEATRSSIGDAAARLPADEGSDWDDDRIASTILRAELARTPEVRSRALDAAVEAALRAGKTSALIGAARGSRRELLSGLDDRLQGVVELTPYQRACLVTCLEGGAAPDPALEIALAAIRFCATDPHDARGALELVVSALDAPGLVQVAGAVPSMGAYANQPARLVLERAAALGTSPPEALRHVLPTVELGASVATLDAHAERWPHNLARHARAELVEIIARLERPAAISRLLDAIHDEELRRLGQSRLEAVLIALPIERWEELATVPPRLGLQGATLMKLTLERLLLCLGELTSSELLVGPDLSIAAVAPVIREGLGERALGLVAEQIAAVGGAAAHVESS